MGIDSTPDSSEPEGRNQAPVGVLLVILAIVVLGAIWVLWNSFNRSGVV